MRNIILKFTFLTLLILLISEATASHLLGTDLTYECLGPGQYRVTLTLYRDCNGIAPAGNQTLNFSSNTCNVSGAINLAIVGAPVDITPLCSTQQSACNGNGNFGVQQYIYQGILNLPPGCGDDWILDWSQCCRNNAINTLNNPGGQNMYIGAMLDNTTVPFCNSSPVFNNAPGSIVCVNQPVVYNHGVNDADGDSLYFSFGACFEGNGNPVNYAGGFNQGNPLSTSGGVSINSSTGAISFTPNQQQVGVICVNVKEYRNGVFIGEVNRDMQFTVIQCANIPPQASGVNGASNTNPVNFETSVCANGDLCFNIDGSDANTNNVTMSWNNEIPSATFVVSNNNTANPSAQFCWNPGPNDVGTHVFTVNVTDDACPIVGSGTYTYIIEVTPSPNTLNAGADQTICFGETAPLNATSTPAATSFTWSPSATLSSATGASVVASPLSTTSYQVSAAFPDGCDLSDVVMITVAPNPVVSVTPSSTFNCSGQATDFSATAHPNFSYTWTPGGMNTANITVFPTSTTTYTVDVVENVNGCTSTASATVTIAAPTGNVCNVLYVSPGGSPSGTGSKADPMDLITAMEAGACNGTTIKMAIGDYVTDSTINRVTSYLTLEGGFDSTTPNWDKLSTAGGISRILRTATRSTSTTGGPTGGSGIQNEFAANPEITAITITNQTGFRFQDITIRTELSNPTSAYQGEPGIDVTGLKLSSCDQYDIVRTQINTSQAGKGGNQMWSIPAENGGNAKGIEINMNGAGSNIIESNITAGAAGSGGNGNANGSPTANQAGTAGTSQAIDFNSGVALVTTVSNFNLTGQPAIRMDDIACTATNIDFFQAISGNWSFGLGSTPTTATGSSVTTLYNSLGRKNIAYGANTYTGFTNILLDSQVLPAFTTSAPLVAGEHRICAGDMVNFSATNGGTGYNYHWDMGGGSAPNNYDGITFQTLNNIVFNTPGIYTIELQFETNCCGLSIPTTLDIHVEEVPTATVPADQNICEDGTPITISIGGMTANGSIIWSPGTGLSNNNTPNVVASPGVTTTYGITLTDSTGLCTDYDEITVNVITLDLATSSVNASCGTNGSVSVIVSGGSGNYTYQWDDPANQTTATATGLQVGNYNVVVTDNISGCMDSALAVVNPTPNSLVGYMNFSENVSCVGNADGRIVVSVNGGVAPFDYVWNHGSQTLATNHTSDTISNLNGGNYEVVITDANNCSYTVSGFVAEPDTVRIVADSIFNPTCQGANDGFIAIIADGGVAPLVIQWDDPANQTGQTANGLGAGTYCALVTDQNGCQDSMCFTLTAPLLRDTVRNTICYQEAYVLPDGTTIHPSNDTSSVDSLITPIGCDSIVTTFLTVETITNQTYNDTICAGDIFTVHGFNYTSQGTHRDTLFHASGCDSVVFEVNLTVDTVINETYNDTICAGDIFTVHGFNYTSQGTHRDTLFHASGCDSVVFEVNLTVDTVINETYNDTICAGDIFTVHGFNYTSQGTHRDTLFHASGCDSVVFEVNLTVDTVINETYNDTICAGDIFTVHGFNYTSQGTHRDTLFHASGCDSVVFEVNLTVDTVINETYNDTICAGDIFTVHGFNYTSQGTHRDTLFHASGCDSVIFEVNLTVDTVINETYNDTICAGDIFTVHGFNYTSQGTHRDTLFHASGCDSVVFEVNLTVDTVINETYNDTICAGDIFTVHGFNYTSQGTHRDTLFHASGCDSVVFEVNLTVVPLPTVTGNVTPNDTLCEGDLATLTGNGAVGYEWNNNVDNGVPFETNPGTTIYIVTGTDANGCTDTDTIDLFGAPTYNIPINATICEDETHTLPDGNIVNIAGVYTTNIPTSQFGCDSIFTTTLTVNQIGSFTPLEDVITCNTFSQTLRIASQNMVSFEWFVNDGTGNVSLIGNPDYLFADTDSLSFNLDTSLHQNMYTVQMTDECGNLHTSTMTLEVFEPHAVANGIEDTTFCLHEIGLITVNYDGHGYEWSQGTLGASFIPEEPGEYIVTFTENYTGCILKDTINIDFEDCIANCVVLAPTGFSPDASGVNDIFSVVSTCEEGFSHFQFNIYNRWGELIYATDDWRKGWDGTYKGRVAEIGTYTYFIEYTKVLTNKTETLKGNITLIR